jgi:thiol:disulfide interchange protein DsbC
MHKDAYWKSKSIICERSLKMLEDSFAHKEIPRKECDAKEIDDNIKLAQDLGVSGTPTIVFPDGRVHSGFLTAQQLVEVLFGKK